MFCWASPAAIITMDISEVGYYLKRRNIFRISALHMHSPFPFIFLISTIPCLPLSGCTYSLPSCSIKVLVYDFFHCLFRLSTWILLLSYTFRHHSNKTLGVFVVSVQETSRPAGLIAGCCDRVRGDSSMPALLTPPQRPPLANQHTYQPLGETIRESGAAGKHEEKRYNNTMKSSKKLCIRRSQKRGKWETGRGSHLAESN